MFCSGKVVHRVVVAAIGTFLAVCWAVGPVPTAFGVANDDTWNGSANDSSWANNATSTGHTIGATAGTLILDVSAGGTLIQSTVANGHAGNSIGAPVQLNDDLTVDLNGLGGLSIAGLISSGAGATNITKTGPAALTLSGANTFTGNLTINGGIVGFGADTALGNVNNAIILSGRQPGLHGRGQCDCRHARCQRQRGRPGHQ